MCKRFHIRVAHRKGEERQSWDTNLLRCTHEPTARCDAYLVVIVLGPTANALALSRRGQRTLQHLLELCERDCQHAARRCACPDPDLRQATRALSASSSSTWTMTSSVLAVVMPEAGGGRARTWVAGDGGRAPDDVP